jgi:hypothetical protein
VGVQPLLPHGHVQQADRLPVVGELRVRRVTKPKNSFYFSTNSNKKVYLEMRSGVVELFCRWNKVIPLLMLSGSE